MANFSSPEDGSTIHLLVWEPATSSNQEKLSHAFLFIYFVSYSTDNYIFQEENILLERE